MGQLVLGAAGAAIGSALVPGIGGQLGFVAGSLIGGFLFPPAGPKLPDLTVSSAAWGNAIPILYGTARVAGSLIWSSEPVWLHAGGRGKGGGGGKGGGKGGGPFAQVNFAMAICEGVVQQVLQIYADALLVYDSTGQGPISDQTAFTIYYGTETQMPDPNIVTWVTQNIVSDNPTCPAYRGLCYIVFPNFNLSNFGNRIPSISVVLSRTTTTSIPTVPFKSITGSVKQGYAQTADTQRKLIYSIASDGYLHVYNMNGLQEITRVSMASAVPNATNSTPPTPWTSSTNGGITCVPGGDIFVTTGTNSNNQAISRIHGDSFTPGGTIGSAGNFWGPYKTANPNWPVSTPEYYISGIPADFSYMYGFRTPLGGQAVFYMSYIGQQISACIFDGTTMGYIWGDSSDTNFLSFAGWQGKPRAVQGKIGSAGTDLWVIGGTVEVGTDPNFYIYKMVVAAAPMPPNCFAQHVATVANAAWTSVGNLDALFYDETDDTLIIAANVTLVNNSTQNVVFKLNLTTFAIVWVSPAYLNVGQQGANQYQGALSNGTLALGGSASSSLSSTNFVVLSTVDGSILWEGPAPTAYPSNNPTNYLYSSTTNSAIACTSNYGGSEQLYEILFQRTGLHGSTVAFAVTDLCERAGVPANQIDVSSLTQTVNGYVVSRDSAAKDCLAQLTQAFLFDIVESDGKLVAKQRGTTSVATIPQDALASVAKDEDGNYWTHTRVQQQEVPVQVNIKFRDINNRFQDNASYAKRVSAPTQAVIARKKVSVDMPMAMDLDQATSIAQAWLWTIWMERDTYEAKVGQQYLWLDPADNVTVAFNDGSTTMARISEINTGADYSVKLNLQGEDASTYTYNLSGLAVGNPYNQNLKTPSAPRLLTPNVPLLLDTDDTGGTGMRVYYTAGAYAGGMVPSAVYASFDGESWLNFDEIPTSATWGVAIGALADTPTPYSTDNKNTLTVQIVSLSNPVGSDTPLNVLNGTNMAIVGNEVIQWQQVAVNSDGTYTLSKLLRARRGTEWATATHVAGELFIVVDNNLHKNVFPLAAINTPGQAKLVPYGKAISDVDPYTFTYIGYDLKPYAPVGFSVLPVSGGLTLSWVRRTRINGGLFDAQGTVPLNEETESYDLYILNAPYNSQASALVVPPAAQIVRTITGLTSPTYTYTTAMMTADGFNPTGTTPIHLLCFQNSALVGHGFPGFDNILPVDFA